MHTICHEAFLPFVETVVSDYNLPLPDSIPSLKLSLTDLLALVWIPWDHMIRTSFSLALDCFQIQPTWDMPAFESLLTSLLPSPEHFCLQHFADIFSEVIHELQLLLDVFAGLAPFTNATLKKLASAGSYYFDRIYAQLATIFNIQTTTKQNLPAPNHVFVEVYDLVLYSVSPRGRLYQHRDQYLGRRWNNEGNSMEALAHLLVSMDTAP